MRNRVYNFNAGPAVLPLEVLRSVEQNLFNYQDTGIGILELSHRSDEFLEIISAAEASLRSLLGIEGNYRVLFMTGGATNQFSTVAMNCLTENLVGNYVLTDVWSEKALAEAKKFGKTHIAASSKDQNFSYIPSEFNISEDPAYLHFTSNNTVSGTQFHQIPDVGDVPIICDASSDLLHRRIDVSKFALIYAGAQKNLGPAGVTIVIIRDDLLQRSSEDLPIMQNYATYAESGSLYNTPPTFSIYVVREVLNWIKENGGLEKLEGRNRSKARLLYELLEDSSFYTMVTRDDSASLMNVCFRLANTGLEGRFFNEAEQEGLVGLQGHRSVGGIRASIYNAFPLEGVLKLVEFMKTFEKKYLK